MTPRTATQLFPKPALLDAVFDDLKAILAKYAKSFAVREGAVKNKRDYHPIVEKPLVIDGRKKDELWFASVIQQKHSVAFYFMPLYCCKDGAKPSSELMGHFDGKCRFHVTSLTPGQTRSINDALKVGLAAYKKRKWL
jgi:hypothetical protein